MRSECPFTPAIVTAALFLGIAWYLNHTDQGDADVFLWLAIAFFVIAGMSTRVRLDGDVG